MKSKDFIILKLQEFIRLHPLCTVKYKHEAELNEHLIEFISNEKLSLSTIMSFRIALRDEFSKTFYDDEVIFVSETSLVKVDKQNLTYIHNGLCGIEQEPAPKSLYHFDLTGIGNEASPWYEEVYNTTPIAA